MSIGSLRFAFLAALVLSTYSASADVITNGGFELDSTGHLTTGSADPGSFYGWTISTPIYQVVTLADTPNSVQQNMTTGNGYYVYDGSYAAQLGSLTSATLSQTFTDVPGQTYDLSFYLHGDTFVLPNGVESTNFIDTVVAGSSLDLINVRSGWTQYNLDFIGTGSDVVSFQTQDLGLFFSLDDVSANPTSPVPEPSTFVLLGTAILAWTVAVRMRSSAA